MTLIKSKERVRNHGEVFTPEWVVKNMCDLVRDDCENIHSKFLEPACGDGNFLVEILTRKLKNAKTIDDTLYALESLYGIDILYDNVYDCRANLLECWRNYLADLVEPRYTLRAQKIINKNIICGDFISCRTDIGTELELYNWEVRTFQPLYYLRKNSNKQLTLFSLCGFGDSISFDVIIGNPPYNDTTRTSDNYSEPLYNKFVLEAKKYNPKNIVFITPSRWLTCGQKLKPLRDAMLTDLSYPIM